MNGWAEAFTRILPSLASTVDRRASREAGDQYMRRILTIDGGGIRGAFSASFLAAVEDSLGHPVREFFDLVVGTSTGGIIALGLGLGVRAKEILEFYETQGPSVFAGNRLLRRLRHFGLSKYDSKSLESALSVVFGERRFGESRNRLVIPSCNLVSGEVHVWKTAHHPRLERDYRALAVEVALSTAAAPTYFPAYRSASGLPLVDGGVWANNPTGVAVVEAVGVLGWRPDSLRVLSIGCTSALPNTRQGRKHGLGLAYWGPRIAEVFMAAQSSASMGTAIHLVSDRRNIVRVAPPLPGDFKIDSIDEISTLVGLGDSEARKAMPDIRGAFFGTPARAFTPCYELSRDRNGHRLPRAL